MMSQCYVQQTHVCIQLVGATVYVAEASVLDNLCLQVKNAFVLDL